MEMKSISIRWLGLLCILHAALVTGLLLARSPLLGAMAWTVFGWGWLSWIVWLSLHL
jgi:hypothetical protein